MSDISSELIPVSGPEVVGQAVRVLQYISDKAKINGEYEIKLDYHLMGGAAIDATGNPLPDSTLEASKAADAILLGTKDLHYLCLNLMTYHRCRRGSQVGC